MRERKVASLKDIEEFVSKREDYDKLAAEGERFHNLSKEEQRAEVAKMWAKIEEDSKNAPHHENACKDYFSKTVAFNDISKRKG